MKTYAGQYILYYKFMKNSYFYIKHRYFVIKNEI